MVMDVPPEPEEQGEGCCYPTTTTHSSSSSHCASWPPEEFSSDIVAVRSNQCGQEEGGGGGGGGGGKGWGGSSLENEVIIEYDGHTLRLNTILEEDELAPLFDGAYWPGSMVWPVSVWTGEFIHMHYRHVMKTPGAKMIELGCGCGVPGMMASLMGASSVALTEQPELIRFIDMNLKCNFNYNFNHDDGEAPPPPPSPQLQGGGEGGGGSKKIFAESLFWSRENAKKFMTKRPDWTTAGGSGPLLVVCCDCIYEPFWGDSYVALLDCVDELLSYHDDDDGGGGGAAAAAATGVISVERRNCDGVDKFLALARRRLDVVMEREDKDKGWQLFTLRRRKGGEGGATSSSSSSSSGGVLALGEGPC